MINVSLPVIYSNASCGGDGRGAMASLKGSPFVFSQTRNIFTVVGCNTLLTANGKESAVFGCRSKCVGANFTSSNYGACSEREGCCQSSLPLKLQGFGVDFEEESGDEGCKYAFLGSHSGGYDLRLSDTVPGVLEWGIANDTTYALGLLQQGYYHSNESFTCTRFKSLSIEGEGIIYRYRNSSIDSGEILYAQCRCRRGIMVMPIFLENAKVTYFMLSHWEFKCTIQRSGLFIPRYSFEKNSYTLFNDYIYIGPRMYKVMHF
ncbi:wall-associated receptor kinase-like 10 [Eucalyptus grandis]|uniref:wall-associated receptor kinase-like 10 n=1 Tax=Eucalyptus grandis TaxID=71139 RepID=UPI00192E906F|nr:wall-associated receptor kinase-like 10 [Eucalyptus grandis]